MELDIGSPGSDRQLKQVFTKDWTGTLGFQPLRFTSKMTSEEKKKKLKT